jgi:hypothetical protein
MWKQKCDDEELQALLDDNPTQTTQLWAMINWNHALIKKRPEWAKRHGKVILLQNSFSGEVFITYLKDGQSV